MKIYDETIVPVTIYGTYLFESVNGIYQLRCKGFKPKLDAETKGELKKLKWLLTQILAVPSPKAKGDKPTSRH
jgi:hypothetical protein